MGQLEPTRYYALTGFFVIDATYCRPNPLLALFKRTDLLYLMEIRPVTHLNSINHPLRVCLSLAFKVLVSGLKELNHYLHSIVSVQ